MTLEDRVAALEEKVAYPAMTLTTDLPPMSAAEEAEFRKNLNERLGASRYEHRVLPSRPLLAPETARELLRECVTVVKPGEVLAVRVPREWTALQVRECQEAFEAMVEYRDLGIAVLFMPGEEFAVAKGDPS